jgi:hypothetical protein
MAVKLEHRRNPTRESYAGGLSGTNGKPDRRTNSRLVELIFDRRREIDHASQQVTDQFLKVVRSQGVKILLNRGQRLLLRSLLELGAGKVTSPGHGAGLKP